jgi:hypothetical protein
MRRVTRILFSLTASSIRSVSKNTIGCNILGKVLADLVVHFINTVTHRGRRGARLARREKREYREYLSAE